MSSHDDIRGFTGKAQERKRRMDADGGGDAKRAHTEDFSARLHDHALGCVAQMLGRRGLVNFVRVSRVWRAALNQPRVVELKLYSTAAHVLKVTGVLAQHIVRLSIVNVSPRPAIARALDAVAAHMTRVAHLSVPESTDDPADLTVLTRLPCLTFLHIPARIDAAAAGVLARLPLLQHLHVHHIASDAEGVLAEARPRWTSLELDSKTDGQDWSRLARALPALTHLTMAPNSGADVGELATRVQTLSLSMHSTDAPGLDDFVTLRLPAFTRMHTLHLTGYASPLRHSMLTSALLEGTFASAHRLTDLTLSTFHHLGDWLFLRPLRALQRLVLLVDSVPLHHTSLAHLTSLRVLVLFDCEAMDLTFLQPLAHTLTHLTLQRTRTRANVTNLQTLASLKRLTDMTLQNAFTHELTPIETLLFTPPHRALVMPCLERLHGSVPGSDAYDEEYDTFYADVV
jgi:hypothetical protein